MFRKLLKPSSTLCPAHFSTLPKRPANPYIMFVQEKYKEEKTLLPENALSKDVLKSLGKLWKDLPDSERAIYKEKTDTEALKYEGFFKKAPVTMLFELEDKKDKKLFKKKLEDLGRLPKKPPISGYTLFISRQKGIPKVSASENIKTFAKNYQKLSEIEKGKLSEEVDSMKENYQKRMEQILNN